jgi:cation diffusion facilitator family transporter
MTGSGSDAGTWRRPPAEGDSRRTVIVAIIVNVGVAAAKLAAGIFTGSSAMMAEAYHAMADTGNELLLLIAQWRGAEPADDDHRLGHGREAYFWALLASLGVFVTGTLLSLRQGINQLIRPIEANHFVAAYIVLTISFCLEGLSLLRAYRQIKREAGILQRDFLEHLDLTSDPVARAVFAEDATAVVGNVIAFTGIALHQATGSPIPDGVSAILIAVLLGYVAFDLVRRNREFIIGRQAPPPIRDRIRATIAAKPGIVGVGEVLVTFLGPRQLWVVARVDIDNGMTGEQVKAALRAIEEDLKAQSPYIERVYLIPSDL